MKKIRVPIFTEEYAVNIYIGTRKEIVSSAAKYMKCSVKAVENDFSRMRGMAWNCFPELNPLVIVDGDLPAPVALATLAHEASHALDFIEKNIGVSDGNGEFHGHGIAAIMRATGKIILKKYL